MPGTRPPTDSLTMEDAANPSRSRNPPKLEGPVESRHVEDRLSRSSSTPETAPRSGTALKPTYRPTRAGTQVAPRKQRNRGGSPDATE